MSPQKLHVMHGRDHCPGGADPIPCLPDFAGGTSYPDIVQAHPCLVHYWPCDEGSGDLVDRVGTWDLAATTHDTYPHYGAVGPLTEQPELTAVSNAGTYGTGPGDSQRFSCTMGTLGGWSPAADGFTLELWLYLTSYEIVSTILDVGTSAVTVYLTTGYGGNQLVVSYSGADAIDPDDLPLDTWHHIAAVYDGTGDTLTLYLNGTPVATDTTAGSSWGTEFAWLNNWSGPTWSPVNGRGAQLAIYDCPISAADISEHLGAQDAGGDPPAGYVWTADGEGGFSWEPAPAGGDPADDLLVWMPLADSDGTLVLDAGDALIPTLIPI